MTHLGLPDGWSSAALGEVAEIERVGVAPEDIQSGTTYVGLEHIDSSGTLAAVSTVNNGDLASTKFAFTAVHILYGKLRPYLCKIARPDFTGVCSTDILPIRPEDSVDRAYLFHFLRLPRMVQLATARCSGANLPRISPKQLLSFEVPLPPLEEQRRIAAILDKADTIRRKRESAIRLSEQFLRSAFLETIGDPVTNPMAWPIHNLGNHLNFITTGSRGWAKYYAPTGARFIRSLDVQMNRIANSDAVFVNPPKGAESERTRVAPGDVLLTMTGSKIGRVAPVPDDVGEAYISQHVAILRLKEGLRPRFLSMFLSDARGGQHQIRRKQYGQTKPGLNLEQARAFRIPVPPLSKQDEFLALWDRFDIYHEHQEAITAETDDLFHSLVKNAFDGKLALISTVAS